MATVCMQTDVRGRTVQVIADTEIARAAIYIVGGKRLAELPRFVDIRPYLDAGMSDRQAVERVLNIVAVSIDEIAYVS